MPVRGRLRAASSFSAKAAKRLALLSGTPRIVGFSIFFARSPSWYAIARQAVAAVAQFGVGQVEGHGPIVALLHRRVHSVRDRVPTCIRTKGALIQMLAQSTRSYGTKMSRHNATLRSSTYS